MKIQPGTWMPSAQADRILHKALALLSQLGIAVPEEPLQARAEQAGFSVSHGRVTLPEGALRRYLETLRTAAYPPPSRRLGGKIGIYASRLGADEGEATYFTRETLARQTQLCQALAERYGIEANAPGYAHDVPGALESLHKYMVSCLWCGHGDPEPSSALSADWLFPMAEAMGSPIRRLPAFPPSPLTLAGSSVLSIVRHAERLDSAYVYTMSMMGISTPMSVTDGFAVNLAETLGCAYLLHAMTGLRVDIRPNLLPFDLRTMGLSFGSPEKFLLERMAADLYAQLLGEEVSYRSTNVHTLAKRCGAQSCFERGSLMTAGCLQGARYFYCIGSLALDEIFSPLQLIVDLEMMRQLETLIAGLEEAEDEEEDLTAYVREHLQGGFLNTDRTLDHYDMVKSGGIFDRSSLAQWQQNGCRDALEAAREQLGSLEAQPCEKKITPEQERALNDIYAAAERALA